jgi:hypothetical protein
MDFPERPEIRAADLRRMTGELLHSQEFRSRQLSAAAGSALRPLKPGDSIAGLPSRDRFHPDYATRAEGRPAMTSVRAVRFGYVTAAPSSTI